MVKEPADNGWSEYQKLVMATLEDLKQSSKEHSEQVSAMRTELALIKQKASFWGAVSGCVGAVITIGGAYLKGKVAP